MKTKNIKPKGALIVALIGVVTSACGTAQQAASTKTASEQPLASKTAVKDVKVSTSLLTARNATALSVTYSLVVENLMGDAADGNESPLFSNKETRTGALSDVTATASVGGASGSQRYIIDAAGKKLYVKGPASALGAAAATASAEPT